MISRTHTVDINFGNGNIARAVHVDSMVEPTQLLDVLGLPNQLQGVIAISGGASYLPKDIIRQATNVIQAIINLAFTHRIALIDGGTKSGVMEITGACFRKARSSSPENQVPPLIGFAPTQHIHYPSVRKRKNTFPLDPNHPFFVLIDDAKEWGDEVKTMFACMAELSVRLPSIAVVANGGMTTLKETIRNVDSQRQIIILEGSSRVAHAIATAVRGGKHSELIDLLMDKEKNLISPDDPEHPKILAQALEDLDRIANYSKVICFSIFQPANEITGILVTKLNLS